MSQSTNVKSVWAAEEAKTAEERRGGRQTTKLADLEPWTIQATRVAKYKNVHSIKKPQIPFKPGRVWSLGLNQAFFYMAPDHVQDAKDLKAISEYYKALPKEEGSPYTANAAINRKVCIWRGNITNLEVDAIVNAANTSLLGGGGVDGAIHSAAGESLYDECRTLNGAETGETKITRGHGLPSRFVLHTVGPVGENKSALTSCYNSCLQFIDGSSKLPHEAKPIKTIAFCGVSTGIYGYPLVAATKVALETTRKWLEGNHDKVDMVVFCNFLEKEVDCYTSLMPYYFPPAPDAEFTHGHTSAPYSPSAAGSVDHPTTMPSSEDGAAAGSDISKKSDAAEEDDDVDLFGEETEEEKAANEARKKATEDTKKAGPVGRSAVILDVKPWDEETDMKALEEQVRAISLDGLEWKASKLIPVAFGISALQIMCHIIDDAVSVDEDIIAALEALEDHVQSVDVFAFNKL